MCSDAHSITLRAQDFCDLTEDGKYDIFDEFHRFIAQPKPTQ